MKLNWGHFETMTSDDKGHEPDSFHWDWDRDSGTRVFSHPVELPRSSSRVLLPLKSSQRQGLWPDSYIVWDTPDTLPAPSSAPTKCTCVCARTHAHTHTHTHTYKYLMLSRSHGGCTLWYSSYAFRTQKPYQRLPKTIWNLYLHEVSNNRCG